MQRNSNIKERHLLELDFGGTLEIKRRTFKCVQRYTIRDTKYYEV